MLINSVQYLNLKGNGSSCMAVAYPGILFRGVQQIHLRTEDRDNRDLGAVAP